MFLPEVCLHFGSRTVVTFVVVVEVVVEWVTGFFDVVCSGRGHP